VISLFLGTGIVDYFLNSCLGATFLPVFGTWSFLWDRKATETSFSCQQASGVAVTESKAMGLPVKYTQTSH